MCHEKPSLFYDFVFGPDAAWRRWQGRRLRLPEDLSTKQLAVDTPLGWKANSNIVAKTGLAGISLYKDPPDQGSEPIDPVKKTMAGGKYLTWAFNPARKTPVWMACEYHDTAVILIRAMPDTVRQCRYQDTAAYDQPHALDCQ